MYVGTNDSETARVQAKRVVFWSSSYNRRGVFRNGFPAGGLDRILREALAGEIARSFGAGASPLDEALRACSFRLERFDTGVDRLHRDSASGQVVADQEITRVPFGQPASALLCEARVVDRSSGAEALDDLAARHGIDVRALETSVELRRRDVASPDDTRGLRHRLVTAQLSTHTAHPLPIELHAHVEPSA